ncbi:MAG: hypothetical protein F4Z59_08505, partial [Gemmatimonadales bacterium]|nr:hypothetical protein [Gemmatimonadales bacterium]
MSMDRRDFVRTSAAGLAAAATPAALAAERRPSRASDGFGAPAVHASRDTRPIIVSDLSGIRVNNGGHESAV